MKFYLRFFPYTCVLLICVLIPTVALADILDKPTNLRIRQVSETEAQLTWSKVGNSTDFEVSISNGGQMDQSVTSETLVNISNLEIGIPYTVQVLANNGGKATLDFMLTNAEENAADQGGLLDSLEVQSLSLIGDQKVHGQYSNNTNTCVNCHSTHQAKRSTGLLTSSTVYETCISCHDGSMGFYNVFETDMTKDNGAGTFGGSLEGNMSIHMAKGDLKTEVAPGYSVVKDGSETHNMIENGKWSSAFSCTSCHNPHGSTNDRLLQTNPNGYSRIPRQLINGVYYGGLITDQITVTGSNDADQYFNGLAAAQEFLNGSHAVIPVDHSSIENYKALRVQVSKEDKDEMDGPFRFSQIQEGDYLICLFKFDWFLNKWILSPFNQKSLTSGDGIELYRTSIAKFEDWKVAENADNPDLKENVKEDYKVVGWIGYLKFPSIDEANKVRFVSNLATLLTIQFPKLEIEQHLEITKSALYKVDHTKLLQDQYSLDENGNHTDEARLALSTLNQYNEWCSSCHIGFNLSNQEKVNQSGTALYTHHSSSAGDKLSCIQCHYAHGTDATWMRDKDGIGVADILKEMEALEEGDNYTTKDGNKIMKSSNSDETKKRVQDYFIANKKDLNTTSALKRYSNTASCYRCHGTIAPSTK